MTYFSIVMPVYNGEKYVKTAINSVLQQSFSDFELIVIDDGSTDDSKKICEMLLQSDKRITVISQSNQGALLARKIGVRISKGKYILFLDCDDTFQTGALKKIYHAISTTGLDMLMFNYNIVDQYGHIKEGEKVLINNKLYSGQELFLLSMNYFGLLNSLGTKAVKAEVVKQAFEVYSCNISMAEDLLISLQIFRRIYSAVYLEDCLYNYIDNPNSSMHRVQIKFFSEYEFVYLEEVKMIREYHIPLKIEKKLTENFLVKIMADYFFYTFQQKITFTDFVKLGKMISTKAYMNTSFEKLNLGTIWNLSYRFYLLGKYRILYLYFGCLWLGYRIKHF